MRCVRGEAMRQSQFRGLSLSIIPVLLSVLLAGCATTDKDTLFTKRIVASSEITDDEKVVISKYGKACDYLAILYGIWLDTKGQTIACQWKYSYVGFPSIVPPPSQMELDRADFRAAFHENPPEGPLTDASLPGNEWIISYDIKTDAFTIMKNKADISKHLWMIVGDVGSCNWVNIKMRGAPWLDDACYASRAIQDKDKKGWTLFDMPKRISDSIVYCSTDKMAFYTVHVSSTGDISDPIEDKSAESTYEKAISNETSISCGQP